MDELSNNYISLLESDKVIEKVEHLLKIYDYCSSIKNNKNDLEFEVRIGSFENDRFISSVPLEYMESVRSKCNLLIEKYPLSQVHFSQIWDTRFENKKRLRGIYTDNNAKRWMIQPFDSIRIYNNINFEYIPCIYTVKKQIDSIVNICSKKLPVGLRISLCNEEHNETKIPFLGQPKEYVISERLSYLISEFQIDFTTSWSSNIPFHKQMNKQNITPKYSVEIEYHPQFNSKKKEQLSLEHKHQEQDGDIFKNESIILMDFISLII